MIKVLFICHGNICRSPMAEFVMKDLVKKAGLESQFHIESAATSREEIGSPVYPPARRKLAGHGISCEGHAARQLTNQDYDAYDLLIGMDQANLRNMYRICGGDFFISDWLRNRNTVEFLGIWEQIHNPDFNYGEFAIIRSQAGLNSYKLSVKESCK